MDLESARISCCSSLNGTVLNENLDASMLDQAALEELYNWNGLGPLGNSNNSNLPRTANLRYRTTENDRELLMTSMDAITNLKCKTVDLGGSLNSVPLNEFGGKENTDKITRPKTSSGALGHDFTFT
jgi:hypothetical protein